MVARKAQAEGNCRQHNIGLVRDITMADRRFGDTGDDYSLRDDSCHLGMVRTETATKYRATSQFSARWTV
jgi:hypothetical protein